MLKPKCSGLPRPSKAATAFTHQTFLSWRRIFLADKSRVSILLKTNVEQGIKTQFSALQSNHTVMTELDLSVEHFSAKMKPENDKPQSRHLP